MSLLCKMFGHQAPTQVYELVGEGTPTMTGLCPRCSKSIDFSVSQFTLRRWTDTYFEQHTACEAKR